VIVDLGLFVAALAASALGSMVGLGGGFLMVPILRLAFGFDPAVAAGMSLAMVVANGASSTIANLRARRVNLRVGLLVVAGGIPGALLGSRIVERIASPIFDWLFAALVVGVALDFALRRSRLALSGTNREGAPRTMHPVASVLAGFFAGILGGLFGIGGGIAIVPALAYFSDVPIHSITATSQFAIALTSPIGFVAHALAGDVDFLRAIPLFLGGIVGGTLGPRIAARMHAAQLLSVVSIALVLAAAAMLLRDTHVL